MQKGFLTVIICLLAILVGSVATSSQSLWIDEANSAIIAIQDSFSGFQKQMREDMGSSMQMPLYMLALWGWEKLFGSSEFALRAMNLPLFLASLLVLAFYLRVPQAARVFTILLFSTSCFVWAYLDEARPYILQLTASVLVVSSLVNVSLDNSPPRRRDLVVFTIGSFLLCASSLIGVLYTLIYGLAFLTIWLLRAKLLAILHRPDVWACAVLGGVPLILLGVYYAWTLSLGARASGVGSTNWQTLLFSAYELLGFSGLGPGRNALREEGVSAIFPYFVPLAIYGVVLVVFLGSAGYAFLRETSAREQGRCYSGIQWKNYNSGQDRDLRVMNLSILGATVFVSVGTIALLGLIGEFRIVGRHYTPLLPFILITFGIIAAMLWKTRQIGFRFSVVGLITISLFSALNYRFNECHAKEDYRSAAKIAKEALAQGSTVWWAADRAAGIYYGLPLSIDVASNGNQEQVAFHLQSPSAEDLKKLPHPDLVVLSKPDVYDAFGFINESVQKKMKEKHSTMPGFIFWVAEQN